MKKYLLIAVALFACQSSSVKERKDLEKNLFTFFNETLKREDNTLHLDSIRIIKYDTISESAILYKKISMVYDEVDDNQKLFNITLESRNNAKQMIRLTAGLSSALYNNSLDDYKKENNELISIHNKDSMLIKKADSLTGILKSSDSTTLLYLQVQCIRQYQRRDLSVKRDTVFAFLNKEKNIVRREDIFN